MNIDGNVPTIQACLHLKNLESLSLESLDAVQLNSLVTRCPPKLKSFSCSNLDLADLDITSSLFNNCMTKLALTNALKITAPFISSLPQSLTDLKLTTQTRDQQPFAFLSLLPRNLKSLHTNLNIVEKMSLLPESLTFLSLTSENPYDASCFDRLPSKLEILNIKQPLPRSIMKQLPPSLIDLYAHSDELIDDQIVRMLPRSLKQIYLDAPDAITDAGAGDLPPCLESLFLSSNTQISDHGIELLPRSLTRLALPENSNFTDECVKHLPRKLIALHLIEATKITSKSCIDLPRYLSVLALSNCEDWDPETLIASKNELPQFMERAEFGNLGAIRTCKTIIKNNQKRFRRPQKAPGSI